MQQIVNTRQGDMCIRPYVAEDEAKALQTWQAAFDHAISPELWGWKYLSGPYKHQLMLCVTESGDIAALYGGVPLKANFQGETRTFTHLMDSMSHPEYRGSIGGRNGVFVQTVQAYFSLYGSANRENSLLLYGFPGKRAMGLGKRMLGYESLANDVEYLQLDTAGHERPLVRLRSQMYKLELVSKLDERFDRLQQTLRPHYPLAVTRDQKFLQWRFFDHPERKYEVWVYRRRLKLDIEGYLVLSVDDELNRVTLVDFLLPVGEILAAKFLQSMLYELKDRGFSQLQTWLPGGHFVRKAFHLAGFKTQPEPLGIALAVRTFDPELTYSYTADNFFYSMADADLF